MLPLWLTPNREKVGALSLLFPGTALGEGEEMNPYLIFAMKFGSPQKEVVFVFCGCCNTLPQAEWLKSGRWWSRFSFLSEGSREESISLPSQLPEMAPFPHLQSQRCSQSSLLTSPSDCSWGSSTFEDLWDSTGLTWEIQNNLPNSI